MIHKQVLDNPGKSKGMLSRAVSLHTIAVSFVVVIVTALVILQFSEVSTSRDAVLENAERNSANLARSMSQQAADAVGEVDSTLDILLDHLQRDGIAAAQEPRFGQLLKRIASRNDQFHALFVYGKNGEWLATSLGEVPVQANNSDREYFQFHRVNNDNGLHLGPVIASRTTGDLILPMSRRINDAQGNFAGVLLATLRVEYFRAFYAGFKVDAKGVIVLALADGTILVNRSHKDEVIGTSLADNVIFKDLLPARSAGSVTYSSLIDGVRRIHSFERVPDYPLVVVAGLSEDAALRAWRREKFRSMMFFGGLLAAAVLFGLALIRQARISVDTSQRLKAAYDALEALAMQDGLTALANRRQFDAIFPVEVARARRTGQSVGLIMLDIDYFKRYNDTYGHPAGDACIRSVASVIRACLRRPADLAARYGGEEFVVLLPDTDMAGAWKVADDMVRSVRMLAIPHSQSEFGYVTISAGVSVGCPTDVSVGDDLLAAADGALYAAKAAGRNQVRTRALDT